MGVYDSVMIPDFECPHCGVVAEAEAQMHWALGKYQPWCHTYRIGDVIEGWPKIPVIDEVDELWCNNPTCLPSTIIVRIERGRITGWRLDDAPSALPIVGRPAPRGRRGALKVARRRAASDELYARECKAAFGTRKPTWQQALALPLRAAFNYEGFGRILFRALTCPEARCGNFAKVGGKWQRWAPSSVQLEVVA